MTPDGQPAAPTRLHPETAVICAGRPGRAAGGPLNVPVSIVAGGGSVDTVAARLSDLMLKDVTVVREVAGNAGADLGIIGKVLSSEAVEKKVLHQASVRGTESTTRRTP